jgi:hypothetical protein
MALRKTTGFHLAGLKEVLYKHLLLITSELSHLWLKNFPLKVSKFLRVTARRYKRWQSDCYSLLMYITTYKDKLNSTKMVTTSFTKK